MLLQKEVAIPRRVFLGFDRLHGSQPNPENRSLKIPFKLDLLFPLREGKRTGIPGGMFYSRSCARSSNLVNCDRKASFTSRMGPLRFFPMMISAIPFDSCGVFSLAYISSR